MMGGELTAALALFSKSFLKILLVLGGMLMVFLMFPYSRTANLFLAGLIGSFIGGVLLQLASVQLSWTLLTACSISLAIGVILLPLLHIVSQLSYKVMEDQELVDDLYLYLKILVSDKAKKVLDKFRSTP